jgi:hypothetical protein
VVVAGEGSRGPSMAADVGTASNSSNSLFVEGTFGFGGTLAYAFSILPRKGSGTRLEK